MYDAHDLRARWRGLSGLRSDRWSCGRLTQTKDGALRKNLSATIGTARARQLLADKFPRGSAKTH